ncbi:MAG: TRAP transporter substrate-binding protein [Defluviitaleaceae bacterium]|nr:TRAP transporter substrate-binding protein [Defluviitaleaceae bacterium]MCL2261759.1 TRAP transporter substrate-binding protein [Defluviitaleaceae bacterium]
MKKTIKALLVFTVVLLGLSACVGSDITVGQIPPPPPRPVPPAVATPAQGAPVAAAAATGDAVTADVPEGEVFTLSFAHNMNTTHPRGYATEVFAQRIAERSGGRLVVNTFPYAQLGSDAEVANQVLQGHIDITSIISPNLSFITPALSVFDLPYLFFDMEQAQAALSGTLGDHIGGILADEGLVLLGFQTAGFKHLTNNVRPITSVQDMDGLRMRVSQSHFLVAQFQAINAGGISIPWGELPAALAEGLADGQENPLTTIIAAGLHNVQNYLTISNHGFAAYPVIMAAESYNQLPEDLRLILHEVFREVNPIQWNLIAEAEVEQLAYLYDAGMNVNYLSADAMRGFRAAMQVVYDEFAQIPGGATLLSVAARYTN